VERRLLEDPAADLHLSEWNEGKRVWIMEFVAPDYCNELAHHIKEEMFPDHDAIHWLPRRERNAGRPRIWHRKSSQTKAPRKSLLIL
jgi:hemolysin-activating ACP:hemolysin acyltransferase